MRAQRSAVVKIKNVENLLSKQQIKTVSVLYLTNDRSNFSGLLLLSTFFVSCWVCYIEGVHLSLSIRLKINVNVSYLTFTNYFIFVTFIRFLTLLLLFWENFLSMGYST